MSLPPAESNTSARPISELDRYLFGEGTHRRLYERLGAHPSTHEGVAGVRFAVWAPSARRVSVVGDWNGWDGRANPMHSAGAPGIWEVFVPGIGRGALYKYELEDAAGHLLPLKSDPYAMRCEVPPRSASIVEGLGSYRFDDADFLASRPSRQGVHSPISIYEVHLGSFRRHADGSFLGYRELADLLVPYVRDLGFTHVELLPVTEHPFYGSWGYQPLGLFAPTGRYGEPDDFRAFVDAFHRAGIGVILDWVPAHFPVDDHGLKRFDGTALYEHADPRQAMHPDWGTLVFDYERNEVRNYLISNALYWIESFHLDGLRVDAVASMLYLDYSRKPGEWQPNRYGGHENLGAIAFLKQLNEVVHAEHPGILVIAEESTAWPMVSKPVYLGGLGFDLKWNMGWMHDTLRYLARDPVHRSHHHDEITFAMLYHGHEKFVLPLSHDEVVHGKRSLVSRMPGDDEHKFANLRLLFAYQWAHGGKKLLFMGGEVAQWSEWNHEASIDHWRITMPQHGGMHALVRDLNHLYVGRPAMHVSDAEHDGFRWIDCSDRAQNVLVIQRNGNGDDEPVIIALNFADQGWSGYRVGVPRPGHYRELINTDSGAYGGQNRGNFGAVASDPIPMHGLPCSVSLYLPPLSAVFLSRA